MIYVIISLALLATIIGVVFNMVLSVKHRMDEIDLRLGLIIVRRPDGTKGPMS